MLSREMNELLTQVGAGTPMGQLFRRFWLPAVLSREVAEPDDAPVRVRMLGEDLVAFRDTAGQVGLIGAYCPHRRAPMFFGRNEECGLRCVYHGWKFDAAGNCVDMPSEPPDSIFKTRVNIDAYPTWEGGGVVWAYLGPRAEMPPFPQYEWVRAPDSHRYVSKTLENANYLQALEGGIDTAHSSFVHNNDLGNEDRLKSQNTHPKLEVETSPHGFRYAGIRDIGNDRQYVRVYHYLLPAMQMRAAMLSQAGKPQEVPTLRGHIWVPVDDEWTMVYNWMCSADPDKQLTAERWAKHEKSAGRGPDDYIEGSWRLKRNLSNDFLVDRELQRTRTYTGITGLNTQDYAVQEGMGPICDRTQEHLGTSDRAIIAARRLLRDAIDDMSAGRQVRGADTTEAAHARPAEAVLDGGAVWQEAMKDLLTALW
ncbi:MAG: aromatic ring-hydroxylating dioxygenase subunit alpha [Actinobacteria bacterium]|nr:aromatic ring-hydroxylating dioxygenase subunit alpha [Actinomycetota bacterium]